MIVAERINKYITQRFPDHLCDACIAKALDLAQHQQVNAVTMVLGTTSDFDRFVDVCDVCGKQQEVTRSAERAAITQD